jgi:hypothetical protein
MQSIFNRASGQKEWVRSAVDVENELKNLLKKNGLSMWIERLGNLTFLLIFILPEINPLFILVSKSKNFGRFKRLFSEFDLWGT